MGGDSDDKTESIVALQAVRNQHCGSIYTQIQKPVTTDKMDNDSNIISGLCRKNRWARNRWKISWSFLAASTPSLRCCKLPFEAAMFCPASRIASNYNLKMFSVNNILVRDPTMSNTKKPFKKPFKNHLKTI